MNANDITIWEGGWLQSLRKTTANLNLELTLGVIYFLSIQLDPCVKKKTLICAKKKTPGTPWTMSNKRKLRGNK